MSTVLARRAFAAGVEVRLDHERRGQLSLRAGGRLQADFVEAGDLREVPRQLAHDFLVGAEVLVRPVGMAVREVRIGGDRLVQQRVVLHRARPERIHAAVDVEVQVRQPRVVADDVDLRRLRVAVAAVGARDEVEGDGVDGRVRAGDFESRLRLVHQGEDRRFRDRAHSS
jgi:hypothetical protein